LRLVLFAGAKEISHELLTREKKREKKSYAVRILIQIQSCSRPTLHNSWARCTLSWFYRWSRSTVSV